MPQSRSLGSGGNGFDSSVGSLVVDVFIGTCKVDSSRLGCHPLKEEAPVYW